MELTGYSSGLDPTFRGVYRACNMVISYGCVVLTNFTFRRGRQRREDEPGPGQSRRAYFHRRLAGQRQRECS